MSGIRKSPSGFTIVEILVSITVAAIVVVALNSVVTTYLHVSQRGRYLNLANSYVESKVEELRNKGYNSLPTGTTSLTAELPSQLARTRSATMVVTNPSGGIKQVDITVTYNDQGFTNSVSYTTYLGELGVGQ